MAKKSATPVRAVNTRSVKVIGVMPLKKEVAGTANILKVDSDKAEITSNTWTKELAEEVGLAYVNALSQILTGPQLTEVLSLWLGAQRLGGIRPVGRQMKYAALDMALPYTDPRGYKAPANIKPDVKKPKAKK